MNDNSTLYIPKTRIIKRKIAKTQKIMYIHAGIPKTATTTIQFLMKKYEPNLNEKDIYIPKTGMLHTKTIYNHAPIMYEIIKYDDSKKWKYLKSMLTEIKDISYNIILLSAEDTSYLYLFPQKLRKLKSILKSYGYTVKIIISDRDDVNNFIISIYSELLKSGYYTKNMYEYVRELKRDQRINSLTNGIPVYLPLDLHTIKEPFQKIFGFRNVIYLKYSNKIVKNFFQIFDITIFQPNLKINKQYSRYKIVFLLYFNRVIRKLHINPKIIIYVNFLLRRLPNLKKFDFPEELKKEIKTMINNQKDK